MKDREDSVEESQPAREILDLFIEILERKEYDEVDGERFYSYQDVVDALQEALWKYDRNSTGFITTLS